MSEPTEVKPTESRTASEVIYEGKYVVVKRRKGFLNAQMVNDPDIAPAEILVYALKELLEKRNEIKANGTIWLNGFGFRVGVLDNGSVVVKPMYRKKAILLSNIAKFIKRVEKAGLKLE